MRLPSHFFCLLILIYSFLGSSPLQAQETDEDERIQEVINEVTMEKIRFPLVDIDHENDKFSKKELRNSIRKTFQADTVDSLVMNKPTLAEAEVHVAINPTDSSNIVVSPMRTNDAQNGLVCPVYYTNDFGKTWQESNFLAQPADPTQTSMGGGDPVLAFDANGRCYLTWISLFGGVNNLTFAMYWAYSEDGGATWNRAQDDLIGQAQGLSGIFDKQWVAVDRSDNSPFQNNVYAVMLQADQSSNMQNIIVRKKTAGIDSFSNQSIQISDGSFQTVQFSSIDVNNNGDIHVSFFGSKNGDDFALYHSISKNGGLSFQSPDTIAQVMIPQFTQSLANESISGIDDDRFYPCPHIEVDNSNGPFEDHIYAVWTAVGVTSQQTEGLDIYFSKSTDNGDSWSAPVVINQDTFPKRHQYYPNLDVNSNGTLIVSWYDRRHDSSNISTNHYVAYSVDGGSTFTGRPVTSTPTDFSTVGLQNTNQGLQGVDTFGIGEYTGVVSTENFAVPVWTDGRQGDGFLNIYAAFVPIGNPNPTSSNVRVSSVTPGFSVEGPYPNPASSKTRFDIRLEEASNVTIAIMNTKGQLLMRKEVDVKSAGEHSLSLKLGDLPQGHYLSVIRTEQGLKTKPLTVTE